MIIFTPNNKGDGYWVWLLIPIVLGLIYFTLINKPEKANTKEGLKNIERYPEVLESKNVSFNNIWIPPDTAKIPDTEEGDLIRYGRELVAHTSVYLGPNGKVKAISNGMNCQNCHLKAGTVPYGNNYAAVASKYPTFRGRSGTVEDIKKRINDCFERSLNGKKLEEHSNELKAMVAYINWVGSELGNEIDVNGVGLYNLEYLERAADPIKGKSAYLRHCIICHGQNGEGQISLDGSEWIYPPIYGSRSYTTGAGLYRLSMFARFIKANMPFGVDFNNPILSDEEAWDIAAYVNTMSRPMKEFPQDWPDISLKPFDYPYGPFADTFQENQHKYGPYKPIMAYKEK